MLTLGIRYLTGRVLASDAADRRRVEWPPHPGRVFMALTAAHFQTGDDPEERAALEWLETQPAPQIYASDCLQRQVVTHYVPVNDKAGPSKAPLQPVTGMTRARQPRAFAGAWLEDDKVYFVWPDLQAETYLGALENLCSKVTRIGHPASLVQMWATQEPPLEAPRWLPDELRATERFRVAGPGMLHYLEQQFNAEEVGAFCELKVAEADGSEPNRQVAAKAALRQRFQNRQPVRLWPGLSLSLGYAQVQRATTPSAPGTVFDPCLLVFALRRIDGPYRYLDLAATLQLTSRFRESLLHHLGPAAPEILSGHSGGGPSEQPHVAFIPLPFVGREHAHGGILGLAVAVPRALEIADRQKLLAAILALRKEGLKLGPLGRWGIDPPDSGALPMALHDRVWTEAPEGARQWATVTPYVYDRHAKAKDKGEYQREISKAIEESWGRVRQSSDVKVEVVVTPVSVHLGAPPSHQFPRLTRKDGSECRHTHAILIFDRPVVGPILLGAGRYRGYGLCRPLGGAR